MQFFRLESVIQALNRTFFMATLQQAALAGANDNLNKSNDNAGEILNTLTGYASSDSESAGDSGNRAVDEAASAREALAA